MRVSSDYGRPTAEGAPKRRPSVTTATYFTKDDEMGYDERRKNQDQEIPKEVDAAPEEDQCGPLQQILTTRQVVVLFILVWLFNFVLAFSSGIFTVLTPYVTSSFSKHALTAIASVVANIISGIIKLPYAKLLDVWGRPHCLTAMVVCTTIGVVMMAACQNVETYCAAQVLYSVGFFGTQFSFLILIADAVALSQRALVMGIISTPTIISIWAYGPATESILTTVGFRWGFGIWAIVIPIFSAPPLFLMFKYDRQARDAGLIPTSSNNNRTFLGAVTHYCKEFDIIGLLTLGSGLSFVLLAISIYSYQPKGWGSPTIISLIVVGCLLIIGFLLYEKYLAPATFLPWAVIKDRSVVFTNITAAALYTSESVSGAYIYSMLIVAFNQSVTHATYISNIEMVGASVSNLLLGLALRFNGRIKYYALILGIPFVIIGQGLMISFRIPDPSIALMVVCQLFLAFGSGIMYPVDQLSLMAVSHAHTPALLAVQTTVVACGRGAGSAIAAALWTGLFRGKLAEYLPQTELSQLDSIYGSLEVQSSYSVGSLARTAIDRAYGETQRVIFIAAISILAVSWISVLFWRDIDVKKAKRQPKA